MNFSFVPVFLSAMGKFWQNRTSSIFLRWNIILITFQFAYLFFRYSSLPPEIPLFFSEPWGKAWLAPTTALFLLPFFSLLIGLGNHVIALTIYLKWPLLSRLLVVFSLVFSVFASLSLYQVIRLAI
ncbi:hypothetical protein COS78_01355 [Candidatus Shapirobacteria bacterium CG06_land_8_20_14_3_00_40_12]|uniref:Uncharacterized protein n=1 Tax=Candidatus Shapirobacteria bacterium CG06_land_8_20_14_3_00_40_12 TaxID=1974881 RepID=A0A2M7ASN3_9BACT|nr:MAG: hypothetical protein COS78_01355 [Candidatus Shapirobacteria bacterium CG06_land_8_20_14_3_00_40_12]